MRLYFQCYKCIFILCILQNPYFTELINPMLIRASQVALVVKNHLPMLAT